ncbi:unnamed protein product [Schistosoma mattheei]|uniref:Uncharacterized protein n=1 Tax=Schistosoma mattheei TaxID=31246 RepID=A0A183P750_9TREM|nr:unnamed protein product [Schistosoma mattheei]
MMLYSGHEEESASYMQGVALVLSKVARKALIGWESHGSRTIKASFETKQEGIPMNVIQCYEPFNGSSKDYKDRLKSIVEKCSGKYLTNWKEIKPEGAWPQQAPS